MYLKTAISNRKFKGRMEEYNAKISFQSKSYQSQSKSYYIMDLEEALLDLEGALLHNLLAKKWRGHDPTGPQVPTSLNI